MATHASTIGVGPEGPTPVGGPARAPGEGRRENASISIAAAVLCAFEGVAVEQTIAPTGIISINGSVLTSAGWKIEAAAEIGLNKVFARAGPHRSMVDVFVGRHHRKKIETVQIKTLRGVVEVLSRSAF